MSHVAFDYPVSSKHGFRAMSRHKKVMMISLFFFALVNILWIGVPFAMAVLWSLVDPQHPWSYPDVFPPVLSFGRWQNMWEAGSLPEALRNTYMIAPAVAVTTITLAMPTAYAFGRMEFKGKRLAGIITLLPMVMPSMILAVFFSALLFRLGLTSPYVNIVIAHTVLALPYAIRILATGFQAVPQDLIDAARDMGAGRWAVFQHTFLPVLKPGLLAASIFCLVISIEEFNMSYVLGAPDFMTIPTILYSFLGYSFIRPDAAVVSLILVIPNIVLMLIIEKLMKGNYLADSTGKA